MNPRGGLVLLHSSLTNSVTRSFVDAMRARARSPDPDPHWGRFSELSLLEPHKLFQNSVSIFQRRGDGYEEPVFSRLG